MFRNPALSTISGTALLVAVWQCCAPARDPRYAAMAALRDLRLDSISGNATVYHRPADRVRAETLKHTLEAGVTFLEAELGVVIPVRLAVLQPQDWTRISPWPYGFPGNYGPPASLILAPAEQRDPDRPEHEPIMDVLLLFHELGHLATFALVGPEIEADYVARLDSVPGWYWEFAATALMSYYLVAERPAQAEAMAAYLDALVSGPVPRHSHLDAWFTGMQTDTVADGTLYVESPAGGANFGWYQGAAGVISARASLDVLRGFASHIRGIGRRTRAPLTPEILAELNRVAPGTTARLDSLRVGWR